MVSSILDHDFSAKAHPQSERLAEIKKDKWIPLGSFPMPTAAADNMSAAIAVV